MLLQERVLATPDEIWKETLQKTAEKFKFIKEAPDYEGDENIGENVLDYYRTLEIEGDVTELLRYIIEGQKHTIKEIAESMISLGINTPVSGTDTVGRQLEEIEYLEKKGLNGFIGYVPPSVILRTDKKDSEYLMRFFVHRMEFVESYSTKNEASEAFDWFRQTALNHNLSVFKVDEKIKSIDISKIETTDEAIELVRKPYEFIK